METRANYALIGAFTLAVIAAAFGFVYWLSGGDTSQKREAVRVVFSGSVSGLAKGASVQFNGIRVGEVTDVRLLPEDPRRVVAVMEVDRSTPIRTDTRARLEAALLTGVTNLALIGGDPAAPVLAARPGEGLPTILADSSGAGDVMETARNVARRADDILARIDKVVADNEGVLSRSLGNLERFSEALGQNAPGMGKFLDQVGQAATKIGPLAARLEVLTNDVDELVRAVDKKRIAKIVENTESFTQALGENRATINKILAETASLAQRLNDATPKLTAALTTVADLSKSLDPAKVGRTIDNADRFAAALGSSSEDVQLAIRQARELSEKLNKSADRIDGVMKAAEGFLGSATGEQGVTAFSAVKDAADAFRQMSENLDRRTASITASFDRFTTSGMREVEALSTDGRRTLNDIGRAVRSLEKNPSRVIFGGSSSNIPEYNGRR